MHSAFQGKRQAVGATDGLRPKVLKATDAATGAETIAAEWSGVNESGWFPLDDKVLVLADNVMAKTVGGVILTDELLEKQQAGVVTGIVVAMGAAAFELSADRVRHWALTDRHNPKPGPGDHVFFQRYSGQLLKGEDGRVYRLMDDRCIAGVRQKGTTDGHADEPGPASHLRGRDQGDDPVGADAAGSRIDVV